MISYEGIDEAELVHGLWHGQVSCGMGTPALAIEMSTQLRGGVTVDAIRSDLARGRRDHDGKLYLDYYRGRALKIALNPTTQTFDERMYDLDAGQGAAQRVVDSLRAAGRVVS